MRLKNVIRAIIIGGVSLLLFPIQFASAAATAISTPVFSAPIGRAAERATKKSFGIYVGPGHSPVNPERFRGYHTGIDFETFPNEKNTAVAVSAICTGKIVRRGVISGYGGAVVQACTLNQEPITVVYGHLSIKSVTSTVGQVLKQGTAFAILGKGYSTETAGERKHLHLSIHKGKTVDVRGYVLKKSELKNWVDFLPYVENKD